MQQAYESDDLMALHPSSVPDAALELKDLKRRIDDAKLHSVLNEHKGTIQEVQYGTIC